MSYLALFAGMLIAVLLFAAALSPLMFKLLDGIAAAA